ncbi:hypothetical protein FMUND_9623 [Fusarium mundagurra]|uniref:Uncharacterized protein n=1 Tax=Fusarium mundagurra TaxID=1567541 RepID=A0A8H5YDL5_9HYPO|nr:hypothetical protein FMUND_9623 [Fusarium mundagurra]
MKVRFVGTRKQDSATRRRRALQANRTRNYRQRQKAREDTTAIKHQGESLSDVVDLVADNEAPGPERDSSLENDEIEEDGTFACDNFTISILEVDDSTISTTEVDPYYEEEIVDTSPAEEDESQTQPQSPQIYAEKSVDLATNDANNDVEYATQKFIQQFLTGIHGCGVQSHRESLIAHIEAEGPENHHRLDRLVAPDIPHTLDKEYILAAETGDKTTELSPDQWRALFTGSTTQGSDNKPKQACLHVEQAPQTPPGISFDVDSILGFVDSPAVATHGIRFYSAPQYSQNISTDVHLTLGRADPDSERPRLIPSRLRDVPHFIFARTEGADFITFHLFFPHLPCSHDFNRLTDEQFSRWFDDIFYPAVRQVYDIDRLQHLPASYRHALATCRAPQRENRLLETSNYQAQLQMSYFLSPQGLQQLWNHILAAVCQPGLQDFRDPELLIQAKGTKLLFKYPDAPSDLLAAMNSFEDKLHDILDFSHISSDRLYIDVGKETCPMPDDVPSREPQTYLWRRCCIRHHLSQLYDGNIPKSGQNFYHESMLRDTGAMTTLTPVRSRLRRGGILYGQMYSLAKEIVDAARTYPFQNPDLRLLALDPQLRNGMQSIGGKPASGKNVTDRAYLASKRRCHYGLTDSKQRSFGVREEYRISWTLFQSVLAVLRSLTPEARSTQLPGPPSYLWAVRTPIFVDYVWHNINKFTTGFELIRAQRSGGLTTWEQTKMMDMFLRCLRVAVGGHDYSREGALWWSRRELPQPAGLPLVYYGLGFSHTLEKYGYCWIEPRIDWTLLKFLPDITGSVLFGNGTLHQRFMKYNGHARHFFGLSRWADLGLEWLRQYPGENIISDQIVSWLCHICLQQMRADVLHSIQGDLRPQACKTILDDHVQFCRNGLSATLVNGMTAVWGNRVRVKSPQEVAQALFGLNDGWLRDNWENKPFRKLHQWICTALQHIPTENMLLQAFNCRLLRYLFVYHWVLPYPTPGGLAPKTKDGKRRWFSIDVQGEPGLEMEKPSQESWYWARNRWRQGYPAPLPQYLRWSRDQWQSWVHRHIGQTLPYEVQQLRNDQESFAFSLSNNPHGLRRNPLRGIHDPVVRDLRTNRNNDSSISHSSSMGHQAQALATSQQVFPSYLQPELEFQTCQQVEQYIASLRKQITDGCVQVFKSQKSPISQLTRRHIISCCAPQQVIQPRLAPVSQSTEQARPASPPQGPGREVSTLEPKLISRCPPRRTVRLYYVSRGSQQPARGKESGQQRTSKPGRPAKYASREEKATADNVRARNKRRIQRQISLARQLEDPFRFYTFPRIMLMFLRCLQFSYTGGLIQKVAGCWRDVRQYPDPSQPNGLRRHEGLGFKLTMERYGYAWFLDKIDWNTLTFRQPYAPYVMFNNPSMQNVYRARYHQVRDVRIDFIRVNKAYQWMLEFSAVPKCLDLLENYFRELCLCAFRKDVFFHVKSALKPEHLESALSGEIPLCDQSVNDAMLKDHQPLQLAQGNRLAVKDIHVLFSWLWKSKDDYFERQGWNEKPYRMLFQQSFHAIKTTRGKAGARKWRQDLKKSFLGSHWILPYPHSRGFMRRDKEEKQFIWWPSAHQGLIRHYANSRQIGTLARPLPASNIKTHPIDGWQLATTLISKSYMPYVIQPEQELVRMPENELYAELVRFREQASTGLTLSHFPAPTLELDNSPERYYFLRRWCPIRKIQVAKTFEEYDEVNECL